MIDIEITITGVDRVIKALQGVRSELGSHQDFLRQECVPELEKGFRRCFQTRGYGRWVALDRDTVLEKMEEGYQTAPLVRTGNYQRMCERLAGLTISRNRLEIRSPVRYAPYMEYGTREIPARPVFCFVAEEFSRNINQFYFTYARRRLFRGLS